jgi:PST family polysaccharide transporter
MVTTLGVRAASLVGTLVLTRFIAPRDYGEVSAAVICVQTAHALTFFSFGQYAIAHKSPPKVCFQAAQVHVALGLLAMIVLYTFRGPIGQLVDAPNMGHLLPGLMAALMLERMRHIPERLLARALQFRAIALITGVGEFAFTGTALLCAPKYGGMAIVIGGLARGVLTSTLFFKTAPRSEWLAPAKLDVKIVGELFAYGAPLMLSGVAGRAAQTWDNLIMARLFGLNVMGKYYLAYSLAETPLIYVAERISDVLMPAFSKMERSDRPSAVVRASGIMGLVVSPVGVGLGAIAYTLVGTFFDARWAGMAPLLMVLSVMTVVQPASWAALSYLQAEKKTGLILLPSISYAALLLAFVYVFGRLGGPAWACLGVGLGYTINTVVVIFVTARATALPVGPYLLALLRPLFACTPMFLIVFGLGRVLASAHVHGAISLTAQLLCGVVVYVGAAYVVAKPNVTELLSLARDARRRQPSLHSIE